eukprot:TRINITY_DN18715_c0_g1_i1.p1 TRINITY_DN18715_c0_g1~~TRINITY_DN18715_c0_g1_i1.p1  ORF type:complete len:293 (+),score=103.39 TRINITY_DN18715_c0_g1_i1:77-955(+)
MPESEKAVTVDKKVLAFTPSNTKDELVITNVGPPITYKLKTSNPTRYGVKPRMGYIERGGSEKIGITFRGVDGKDMGLKDVFQLETRPMSPAEEKARKAYAAGNLQQAMAELGTKDKAAQDMLTYIWRNIPADIKAEKFILDCTLDQALLSFIVSGRGGSGSRPGSRQGTPRLGTPRQSTPRQPTDKLNSLHTAAPASATPAPAPQLTSSAAADVERLQSENKRLKAELTTWEQKREELLSANKACQAAAEELRSKGEVAGVTIPGWMFLVLCLIFFYLGLAMDRFYPASAP